MLVYRMKTWPHSPNHRTDTRIYIYVVRSETRGEKRNLLPCSLTSVPFFIVSPPGRPSLAALRMGLLGYTYYIKGMIFGVWSCLPYITCVYACTTVRNVCSCSNTAWKPFLSFLCIGLVDWEEKQPCLPVTSISLLFACWSLFYFFVCESALKFKIIM